MSKLDELIARLCPNGMEYFPLETALQYEQPTKYIVTCTEYDDSYSIPVLPPDRLLFWVIQTK